jgi:hypothetical protein
MQEQQERTQAHIVSIWLRQSYNLLVRVVDIQLQRHSEHGLTNLASNATACYQKTGWANGEVKGTAQVPIATIVAICETLFSDLLWQF